MPRRAQPRGAKGSLRWVQELVNRHPVVLDRVIGESNVDWRSPRADDEFAEYWDQSFLDRLGIDLVKRPLKTFWPRSGPRWDALGRAPSGAAILVEAKSHVLELSSAARGVPKSRKIIEAAFGEVAKAWGVSDSSAWLDPYYQYANRLAHAFLLNELNGIPAILVFLHFVGDHGMKGPNSRAAWQTELHQVRRTLGIAGKLPRYVRDAFVDVSGPAPVAL